MTAESGKLDLSITLVSFNTAKLTLECLKSIYDNTHEVSFEIFVVDNDSADGSADMIEKEFPQVHLVRNPLNLGLAAATNMGLTESSGRYVLALNSDTIVQPGAFDTLVRFMDEHPDVGGATPRLVLPDGGEHPLICGKRPSFRSEMLDILSPFSKKIAFSVHYARYGDPIDYTKTQEVPCILWGTSFIVRQEVMQQVGPQDPRFFLYCEDTDWSMRIGKAGWKQYLVAEAVVIHYGGQSTGGASPKAMGMLIHSRCRRMQKHYGVLPAFVFRTTIALMSGTILLKRLLAYWLSSGEGRKKARLRLEEMRRLFKSSITP